MRAWASVLSIVVRSWPVLASGACFSEAPPLADETTTGGETCAIGSEGCFCTDGDGCDAGLECLLPVGVCVAEGCTPGTGLCECADGSCADGYECVQNFCTPVGGGSISTTDPSDGGASVGSTTATTSEPADTGGTTVATDSASDSTTSSSMACADCRLEAQASECNPEWMACSACDLLWMCFAIGGSDECCDGMIASLAWQMLATCVDAACAAVCDDTIACN
jgi:hypothetical protein